MPHVALVDGGVVAWGDAEVLRNDSKGVQLRGVVFAVGTADAKEEVDHVVAGVVVGVDLDLEAHLVDRDVLLDHLLQDFEHLLAAFLTVVLQEEALHIVEFAFLDGAVGFHDGSNEDHERRIDVGSGAGVAVGTMVAARGTER